jgi:fucose permease
MNMMGVFAGAAVTQVLGKFKDEGHFGGGFAMLALVVAVALILQLLTLRPKTIDYIEEK